MSGCALITGISGQDGLYLAELLLSKGYSVCGTARDPAEARARLPAALRGAVRLYPWDLRDSQQILDILRDCRPREIYHLAACASGARMFENAVAMGEINGLSVTRVLDAIRTADASIRFCQASSSELFGAPRESPQTEDTAFVPRSPYGAAKLYAHSMVRIYRARYGLFACSAILYNHESPRRALEFVTRKVTDGAARIKLGMSATLSLGNLEARRDWGFAGDTVRAMWQMLGASEADDYVVATGETHSVRELCAIAFECVGLDYRLFVRESDEGYRAPEPVELVGNAAKIRARLHWRPEMRFEELVRHMVEADMRRLSQAGDGS